MDHLREIRDGLDPTGREPVVMRREDRRRRVADVALERIDVRAFLAEKRDKGGAKLPACEAR